MKNSRWIIVTLLWLLAVHLVTIQPASCSPFDRDFFNFFNRDPLIEPPPWNVLFPYLLLAKTILASVNSILLLIVLVTYLGIYHKTESKFSLGLIMFSMALLLYSLTSNPLLHRLTGFRLSGLGPFTMLPDAFTCIASAILLYLSRQ